MLPAKVLPFALPMTHAGMGIKGRIIDRLHLLQRVRASTQPCPRTPGWVHGTQVQLATSSDNRCSRLGFPGATRRCQYRWWDVAPAWEVLLGLQGKGAATPPENSRFGFRQLVLSWLCHFEMIPLGQCGSKFAKRNLEGNARGKRGGKEMERREMLGSRWLVFHYIPNFSCLSLYGEGRDAVGFASGGHTWTILQISSPKPRGFITWEANLSPPILLGCLAGREH